MTGWGTEETPRSIKQKNSSKLMNHRLLLEVIQNSSASQAFFGCKETH